MRSSAEAAIERNPLDREKLDDRDLRVDAANLLLKFTPVQSPGKAFDEFLKECDKMYRWLKGE